MITNIDLKQFIELMKHSDGECCNFFGYKMDECGGLRDFLGFKENETSQADYFLIDKEKNKAQIIEFTDINEDIKSCIENEILLPEYSKKEFKRIFETDPKKAKKIMDTKIWVEVLSEFKNKWMGSRTILERYCRKVCYTEDLNYLMLIVIKSNADPKLLQILQDRLVGMIGKVPICNTHKIEPLLLVKLPK